jgi:hypothetical protein
MCPGRLSEPSRHFGACLYVATYLKVDLRIYRDVYLSMYSYLEVAEMISKSLHLKSGRVLEILERNDIDRRC